MITHVLALNRQLCWNAEVWHVSSVLVEEEDKQEEEVGGGGRDLINSSSAA